jgi:hypothetical protein
MCESSERQRRTDDHQERHGREQRAHGDRPRAVFGIKHRSWCDTGERAPDVVQYKRDDLEKPACRAGQALQKDISG